MSWVPVLIRDAPSTVVLVVVVAATLLLSSVEIEGFVLLPFVGLVGARATVPSTQRGDGAVEPLLFSLLLLFSTMLSPKYWSDDVVSFLLEQDTFRLSIKRASAILRNVPTGVVRVDAWESPEHVDSSSESESVSSSSSSSLLPVELSFFRHVGHLAFSAVHFFMHAQQKE